jgi:hypothetical protein
MTMSRSGFNLHWLAAVSAMGLIVVGAAEAAPPNDCDRCFALVNPDATLLRHRGVSTNYKLNEGRYRIVFRYSINNCAITVSPDNFHPQGAYDAQIYRLPTFRLIRNSNKEVLIWMNVDGVFADQSFSLAVVC